VTILTITLVFFFENNARKKTSSISHYASTINKILKFFFMLGIVLYNNCVEPNATFNSLLFFQCLLLVPSLHLHFGSFKKNYTN
jgi:hypothetical protein